MKKIRYILGFGILGVLFSFCFAQDYSYRNVEYFSTNNKINKYQFANNVAYNSLYSYTISGGSIVSYSPYYVSSLGSLDNSVFDLSNYSLGEGSYSRNPSGKVYLNNNGSLSLLIGPSYTLFPIVPGNLTTNDLLVDSEPVYIRVNNDSSSCYNYDSINGNCSNSLRSFVFSPSLSYDSLRGQVHDSVINGVDWIKGTISSSIYNSYSFTYAFSGLTYDGNNVSVNSGFLGFRTSFPTLSGDYYVLDYVYLFRLNDLYLVDSSLNFQVIAVSLTGNNVSNYDFIYSIYDCLPGSTNIFDCSFNNGGYLRPSSNGNSFNSYDGKLFSTTSSYDGNRYNQTQLYWRNFLYFLFYRAGSLTFYNSYNPNTNIIEFYRYGYFSNESNSVNYSLFLDSLAGIDIIAGTENPFPDSGGGILPSYSGSVSLNDCIDTEICYDSTGDNGDILRICTTRCVSSGVIASGGYIGSDGTYYFINSPISIENSLKTDDPSNLFTGSYIESGGILSLSYFNDLFQPGAKSIGVCPFKYYEGPLGFMSKLKVGDVYLLMPILCFYSAFQEGKNVTFFDDFDINDGLFSHPLIYGDSKNHKTLFAFFDVLFSIGLLGLIRYLSRHLF